MTSQQAEILGMQALLPGLRHSAERSVELLNEALRALGLPLARLDSGEAPRRGRPPGSGVKALVKTPAEQAGAGRVADALKEPKPGKRGGHHGPMSVKTKRKVGQSSKARWALAKEAGIDTGGKIPGAADLERARKIIARRQAAAASKAA